jgi:hypothetical protein
MAATKANPKADARTAPLAERIARLKQRADARVIWQHHAIAQAVGNPDVESAGAPVRLQFEDILAGEVQ